MQNRQDTGERYFGTVDNAPESNVNCANHIGVGFQPAQATDKLALALAVGFLHVPTDRASLRGVTGINQLEGHPGKGALVRDFGAQIIERPAVDSSALRFVSSTYPFTNTAEVFEPDTLTLGDSPVYDTATDGVVDRLLEAPLPSREPFQDALCAPRAFSLEGAAGSFIPSTDPLYLVAAEHRAVAQRGNARDSKVDANPPVLIFRWGRLYVNVDTDVVVSLPRLPDHGARRLPTAEKPLLISSNCNRNANPSLYCGEADRPVGFSEGEDAGVVVDACRAYCTALALLDFENACCSGNGTDGKVGCKTMPCSEVAVADAVDANVRRGIQSSTDGDCIVARGGKRPHRGIKGIAMLLREDQLAFDRERLHDGKRLWEGIMRWCQRYVMGMRQFLPCCRFPCLNHRNDLIPKAAPPTAEAVGFRRSEFKTLPS